MNMVDLEKTDAFLAGNISLTYNGEDAQKGSQLHQRIQQLQEEWGLYAVALIRQCVFEHSDASGADGKVYQVSTMKASFVGVVVLCCWRWWWKWCCRGVRFLRCRRCRLLKLVSNHRVAMCACVFFFSKNYYLWYRFCYTPFFACYNFSTCFLRATIVS